MFPRHLSAFACHADQSRGRQHPEAEHPDRSVFQRDRDRIIHSAAFRRLEYKTQVFVNHEGDHYRTRLTHSLEVAQLSRSIARQLGVDEDLAEALALAHDLGHTPFGHAGEEALNDAMKDVGGFDHNAQTIRILTHLEDRYASFRGLNLSWETLEGIAKHNGPLIGGTHAHAVTRHEDLPRALRAFDAVFPLDLTSWPSIEAQIAALSDDIAYHSHDLDDGLRAGLLHLDQVAVLPVVGECFASAMRSHPKATREQLVHESLRRFINQLVQDLVEHSRQTMASFGVASVAEVRQVGHALVSFSPPMDEANRKLKRFLYDHMYRHYKVNRMTSKARRLVTELYSIYVNEPQCLPPEWQQGAAASTEQAIAAADYLAGMTDRFAMQEHRRLYGLSWMDSGLAIL